MTDHPITASEVEQLRRRCEDLADRCQALDLIATLAHEAVVYEQRMAEYQGNRLSAPLLRLADAIRLLYRKEGTEL